VNRLEFGNVLQRWLGKQWVVKHCQRRLLWRTGLSMSLLGQLLYEGEWVAESDTSVGLGWSATVGEVAISAIHGAYRVQFEPDSFQCLAPLLGAVLPIDS